MDNIKIRLVHPSYNLKELLFFNYSIQKYVDTLIIGSNGSTKAHSTILLEKNDVFRSLLSSQEHKEEKVVNLPQFSIEVLKVIIEFLYRGDSRYFKEIEKEVKRAITFFFETPTNLSDLDCVEIKPIVPVVILSDSDNEICDSSQSYPGNVKNETNTQQTTRKMSPTRKRRILSDAQIDSTQNGYKKKKKIVQSNNNESMVNLSPLKHLSQISVSRKKTVEEEVIAKELFKRCRSSEEESRSSNKRHVNPFASNNIELQKPSIQEDALKTKNKRVNILDHTIMESPIVEENATQSPEFLIGEPILIIDSSTIPTIAPLQESVPTKAESPCTNVSQELQTLDELNTNISQEFTNMEEISNCKNVPQEVRLTEVSCTSTSSQPTQMDCLSSPELEVVKNHCTSTADVLSEEHIATKEATTSKNQHKTTPELTKKGSFSKSERPIVRNRIAFDSTDEEDYPSTISTSNRPKKRTTSKKLMQDDKAQSKKPTHGDKKSKKIDDSVMDVFKKPIRFQSHICVICMKEVNDFPQHFNKKHHSLSKTIFPCTKCSHKFFLKFFYDDHQAYCTDKSQCNCIDCKSY